MSDGSNHPRHPRSPNARDTIEEVLIESREPGNGAAYCDYEPVTRAMAKDIRKGTGLDVRGYVHQVNESECRKQDKRHGTAGAADQGVSDSDYKKLTRIVTEPDQIELGTREGRRANMLDTIVYRKHLDGDWLVVVEVRTGAKRLALLSMRKEKAAGA